MVTGDLTFQEKNLNSVADSLNFVERLIYKKLFRVE